MLKDLSIKTRLIFVVGFLCLQLIAGAVIGIVNLARANDKMKSMHDDRLVCLGQLDQVIRMINRDETNLARGQTDDAAQLAKDLQDIEENTRILDEQWKAYRSTYSTEEETAISTKFEEDYKTYMDKAVRPSMEALRAGDKDKALTLLHGPVTELFQPVRGDVDRLIKIQLSEAEKLYTQAEGTYVFVRDVCVAALLFGLALAAVVGSWLVRAISRPLGNAVDIADRIAGGDLTQRIEADSRDEMGRLLSSLRHMNDGLVNIVSQVAGSTETLGSAANQIAHGNLDLSSRTEQQASSLQQTAASMEELTTTVKQNEDNARQANALAMSASEVAVKGGSVVSEVVNTMGAINDSSKKIVDIISVIDGIAFQTNILALNAAVEAARAGEQGRGFAVVAGEVRTLAQRSANAAKEIKALISESVEKVEVGSKLVTEAGSTMGEVVVSVKRVTDIMAEIMAATREQSAGIEQIHQAIAQMDDVTQQNAALVEEAAAAAASMEEQVTQLAQVVSVFKLEGRHAISLQASVSAPVPQPAAVAAPRVKRARYAKPPRLAA